MKRGKKIVKGIISYILSLALTIFFALYMNATVGWFMFVALILAPMLSIFFALLTTLFVKVECKMENCVLAKGDTCQMTVILQNKSLFPTTTLEVEVLNAEGVKSLNKHILVSLLPFEKQSFQITFCANISGPSKVGIKTLKATDYLGLFGFKIRNVSYESLKRNVAVIPNMADVSLRDDKILKVMQASLHAEDGDDTVEVSSNTFGGFPGCDNREYVAGDPLKRVNWKQSAKTGKLLVRLDDVLASKSVNLVLDSIFLRELVDKEKMAKVPGYDEIPLADIPAKIAEDAVENALGIAKALVLNSYSVNLYLAKEKDFERIDLEDEKDIESVRLMLADYEFDYSGQKMRFPTEELLDRYTAFIYSTPNDYKEVFGALKEDEDASRMSVISVIGDAKVQTDRQYKETLKQSKRETKASKDKLYNIIGSMMIPYILALISSMTLFAVFGVSPLSGWTILQAIVCAGIFALCHYARGHKVLGGALISVVIVVSLFCFSRVALSGVQYLQWFMSGADSIENTFGYLLSLIYIFTILFAMVLFYYTQVYYRTSAILLVTVIPYVVYVKLIREVGIGYVMIAIVLNVAAFLINTRKQRDQGKKINGYRKGIASVIMYAVCFVLIAYAIPKSDETKYYHFFEEWFLGGNTSVPVPEEYGDKNEYSGNADNFNQLTNRQLYNVYNADLSEPLYLRRQVFDYYDFEHDRWYGDDKYSIYDEKMTVYGDSKKYLNNTIFLELLRKADEASPGFLKTYNMEHLKEATFEEEHQTATIMSRNFESYYLITPAKTQQVTSYYDDMIYMTEHSIYGNETESFTGSYQVTYISEFQAKSDWIKLGGSNMDYATAKMMTAEMVHIIIQKYTMWDWEYKAAMAFWEECYFAEKYAKACAQNTAQISDEVRALALEITKDCTYEWEKAEAIERYFHLGGFTYDLEYDAPDDSVEYFLFEGKTGTCSDFASAYVLLARAAGLTVRYVEGFVPSREVTATYEWQYVVRTKNSHAYPEVYIPNLGFVVYEPTVSNVNESDRAQNAGVVSYITTVVFRVVAILAGVAFVIAIILIISKIIAPAVFEKYFLKKVDKATNAEAIIMLYRRILLKYSNQYIKEAAINTPYEFARKFEMVFAYDISPLTYLVEKVAYRDIEVDEQDKKIALTTYSQIKKVVKAYKRNKRNSHSVQSSTQ